MVYQVIYLTRSHASFMPAQIMLGTEVQNGQNGQHLYDHSHSAAAMIGRSTSCGTEVLLGGAGGDGVTHGHRWAPAHASR